MQNRKSSIAIVIDDAFGFGGTERVLSNMVSMLHNDYKIDVYSVAHGVNSFYDLSCANKIICFHGGYLKCLFNIFNKINEGGYKSVFLISMGKLSCIFGLLLKLKGGSRIGTIFSCEHVTYLCYPWYVKWLKAKVSSWYTGIVVLTKENGDWIKNKCKKASVYVIPNESPKTNKNFYKDSKKALFVGRLSYQKRPDRLLTCWREFKKEEQNGWCLDVIGDGEMYNDMVTLADDLDISDSVNFRGRVKGFASVYGQASVLLMTSEYEGFPMVLLEAQSYGIPCISFDCPTGPREILDNSDGGIVVNTSKEFIDALKKVSADKGLLERMSVAAKINAERFERPNIYKKWFSLIEGEQ